MLRAANDQQAARLQAALASLDRERVQALWIWKVLKLLLDLLGKWKRKALWPLIAVFCASAYLIGLVTAAMVAAWVGVGIEVFTTRWFRRWLEQAERWSERRLDRGLRRRRERIQHQFRPLEGTEVDGA